MSQRHQVITLYKTFLHLSRDWPQGQKVFRERLHKAFTKNKTISDPDKIDQMIKHGNFVVKEIEALYSLKKYRTLKNRYYNVDSDTIIKY